MNTASLRHLQSDRLRFLALIVASFLATSMATRLILLILSQSELDLSFKEVTGIFAYGLMYDIVTAGYFTIPMTLYLWLVPRRWFQRRGHKYVLFALFFVLTFMMLLLSVSEFFFWDEFKTRFNFIAVDYLIYTTEVIGNIQQSYPVEYIILVLAIVSGLWTWLLADVIKSKNDVNSPFATRTLWAAVMLVLPVVFTITIDARMHRFSNNSVHNELAGNGLYELFAAYRNNVLDYHRFYTHIADSSAIHRVQRLLAAGYHTRVDASRENIEYDVLAEGGERKMNVVLISVESLSASFMKQFGNKEKITPFLDSLALHSLNFTNLYATGTRTVRGLEALSLAVPPTPGQSIVRRPNNEHLFSLGSVFREKGYSCKYIYGGYGYFDNMSYFFGNNGYDVVDRSALSDDEIDYENIWGVADENLFTLSLREIDHGVASGKPVFAHIMTTSNHRPYTYPDGRIDVPSHAGRHGAVKYTDYAIKKFMEGARGKPWFNNTLFVITADHCASSSGKTDLPVDKYQIPMLIYAPGFIAPSDERRLVSQIDIAPTLLGLLNFSYHSKFFGYDIYKEPTGLERAFISTYQSLGYIEHDTLVILSPMKSPEVRVVHNGHESQKPVAVDVNKSTAVRNAISWYQAASYCFENGKMKLKN